MEICDFSQLYPELTKNPDLVRKLLFYHNMKKQFYITFNHTHVKLNGKPAGAFAPVVVIHIADNGDTRTITQTAALWVIARKMHIYSVPLLPVLQDCSHTITFAFWPH